MQFTKLRLIGFKSFVEAQEFVIERGLTGVVGPNGCGKSNLVEALRWVMGESSYKNMRASGMDDVIFSGSNTRPARNSAEVTLFLDNKDHSAPAAFNVEDELQISRRIAREEGSTYRINGKEVRAKDVQLLFADQSTGARSPSMIGQGRVGELIQAKPQARRALLEEAAGISGLHSRRHEAELRLKAAESNLDRLEDVVSDLSSRMESLKRQARQANRYKNLSMNIREVEAALYYLRWSEAKSNEAQEDAALSVATSLVAEKMQDHMRLERNRDDTKAKLPPLRAQAAKAMAAHQHLTLSLKQLDDEMLRNRERQAEMARRLEELQNDISRETALKQENASILERLQQEEAEIEKLHHDSAPRHDALVLAVTAAETALKTAEDALLEKTKKRAEAAAEIAQLRHSEQESATRHQKLQHQLSTVLRDIASLAANLTQFADLDDLRQALLQSEDALEKAESNLKRAEKAVEEARVHEAVSRIPVGDANRVLSELQAESRTLEKMVADDCGHFTRMMDKIEVDKGYETALGAALGDDLEAALEDDAPVFWQATAFMGEDPALPDGVQALSRYVRGPVLLSRRLKQIGLIGEKDAEKLRTKLKTGQVLVSREGGLWRWDGVIMSADAPSPSAQRLAQKNRLQELKPLLANATQKAFEMQERFKVAETKRLASENAEKDARLNVENARQERDRQREQYSETEGRSAQLLSRNASLEERKAELLTEIEDAATRLKHVENKLKNSPDISLLEESIAELSQDVGQKRSLLHQNRLALDHWAREKDARTTRLQRIAEERKTWTLRGENAKRQIAILQERRVELTIEAEGLAASPDDFHEKRNAFLNLIAKAETDQKAVSDQLEEAENRATECDKIVAEAFNALSNAREARGRAEERLNAAFERCKEMEARIFEALHSSPQDTIKLAGFENAAAMPKIAVLEPQLERLKSERERLGAVNLRAEEEESELRNRYDAMTVERDDVVGAIKKLRQAILGLNKEGRERLLAAFDKVNREFQRLFSHLFGGGTAELQLVESDDPLDAGLEILARPPGKKPQTMTLLSGGEQALTAMALIFAVFLTNPAPICVMDEVDAPLDDHNVERYCNLLDEMAASTLTRFVVITHNPITMARMNRLFGVTMAEQGVSQLVSVDLQAAEALREQANFLINPN